MSRLTRMIITMPGRKLTMQCNNVGGEDRKPEQEQARTIIQFHGPTLH